MIKCGDLYQYTISSFTSITLELRHAVVQLVDGKVALIDVFFKEMAAKPVHAPYLWLLLMLAM